MTERKRAVMGSPFSVIYFEALEIFWQKIGTRFINFMSQRYIEKLNKTEVFFTVVLGKHHNLRKCLVIFLSYWFITFSKAHESV